MVWRRSSVWLNVATDEQHPTEGTVAVDGDRILFRIGQRTVTIPASDIENIVVGDLPRTLRPIPPNRVPVTLTYRHGDATTNALVAGDESLVREFTQRVSRLSKQAVPGHQGG